MLSCLFFLTCYFDLDVWLWPFVAVSRAASDDRPPLPPRQTHSVSNIDTTSTLISINEQYIAELTNEGFDPYTATRALNLARNDVNLAREILREFARPWQTNYVLMNFPLYSKLCIIAINIHLLLLIFINCCLCLCCRLYSVVCALVMGVVNNSTCSHSVVCCNHCY